MLCISFPDGVDSLGLRNMSGRPRSVFSAAVNARLHPLAKYRTKRNCIWRYGRGPCPYFNCFSYSEAPFGLAYFDSGPDRLNITFHLFILVGFISPLLATDSVPVVSSHRSLRFSTHRGASPSCPSFSILCGSYDGEDVVSEKRVASIFRVEVDFIRNPEDGFIR